MNIENREHTAELKGATMSAMPGQIDAAGETNAGPEALPAPSPEVPAFRDCTVPATPEESLETSPSLGGLAASAETLAAASVSLPDLATLTESANPSPRLSSEQQLREHLAQSEAFGNEVASAYQDWKGLSSPERAERLALVSRRCEERNQELSRTLCDFLKEFPPLSAGELEKLTPEELRDMGRKEEQAQELVRLVVGQLRGLHSVLAQGPQLLGRHEFGTDTGFLDGHHKLSSALSFLGSTIGLGAFFNLSVSAHHFIDHAFQAGIDLILNPGFGHSVVSGANSYVAAPFLAAFVLFGGAAVGSAAWGATKTLLGRAVVRTAGAAKRNFEERMKHAGEAETALHRAASSSILGVTAAAAQLAQFYKRNEVLRSVASPLVPDLEQEADLYKQKLSRELEVTLRKLGSHERADCLLLALLNRDLSIMTQARLRSPEMCFEQVAKFQTSRLFLAEVCKRGQDLQGLNQG